MMRPTVAANTPCWEDCDGNGWMPCPMGCLDGRVCACDEPCADECPDPRDCLECDGTGGLRCPGSLHDRSEDDVL